MPNTLTINILNNRNWKNCVGTSAQPNCKCGSWKKHWENFSGKPWPSSCSVEGCDNPAEHGAHICNGQEEWIVPMCVDHNEQKDSQNPRFSLKGGRTLVSANRNDTCEK